MFGATAIRASGSRSGARGEPSRGHGIRAKEQILSVRTLAALGWTDELEAAFTTHSERGFEPARVVAEHRGGYLVCGERDERLAHPRGRLRDDELVGGMPAVGDWVAVCDAPGGRAAIEAVLPRRTKVSRKTPWLKSEEHVLVANVDTVFLLTGLDHDFNVRRLERYLTTAWDSGADPVVVLTKLDLCDDPMKLAEAEAVAIGVPVVAVSNVTGEGIDGVEAFLRPARTIALLGSSGVGKSTLVNRLARRRMTATGELRRDGRGRHTTRHRQLLVLPGGALLVDTPGLRELQVWEGDLDSAFADIAELAAQCRFNDCRHETEPGCAVREALETGGLDPERLASYRKLERELRAVEARSSTRVRRELKRRWRQRARETRRARRYRGRVE
jgi:ribosome biogenesis GTPase